jgi:hypothetical protein
LEVERLLGKADQQGLQAGGAHWVWHRNRWEQPEGWPASETLEKPWRQVRRKLLEARFDFRSELVLLIIARKDVDGSEFWEQIGRDTGDWKILRSDEPSPQSGDSGSQTAPAKSR